ncbi:cyclic lactone autoinducer peptide [Peptoclostridium litorale DSM 5388]|uniref:Cyclic lactone autoinducer peptide n=1 Tax=Peptoclostridium litorale DSM 5388 TaxID=1121324 RepID=A0A069RMK5_PEPLI|nr:cyclic lactone autoinducer peptide [Peptoclostridium litorale]KDR95422.1 hypothetical protein CLIT_10c01490 [Peptoclostridium litorale DSM 5388]SIO19082.1 cyclic lactone autoinducer peptide [Peptoclostridium litorale DSM 5388]
MMRRMLQLSITILTFLAFANVASATSIAAYQPEIPEQFK